MSHPVPGPWKSGPRRWCSNRHFYRGLALLLSTKIAHRILKVFATLFYVPHRSFSPFSYTSRSHALVRSLIVHAVDTGILTRLVPFFISLISGYQLRKSLSQCFQSHHAHSCASISIPRDYLYQQRSDMQYNVNSKNFIFVCM
jgi:hypothetical protein